MRYWAFSIAIFLLAPAAWAQNWNENNGKREWAQAPRTKVMVSHELEMISWPGLPDSTYFKIDVGSITDSIWYSGDTTTIGISEYFHARFYNIGNMLEWEAILYQKPGNQFSWTFPIEHNNLDILYQSTTYSEREIELNAYRPDSVKGSYAAYHSYRAWNQYKNSKAFHIYRPKAWDSAGDTVWLDLDIDTVANELTITGNRQWFRDAVYPVTIDPTFGYTTMPGSSVGVNNTWSYLNRHPPDVLGSDGTEMIKTLLFFYDPPSAGTQSYMGIYDWTLADSCADSKVATSSISVTDTDWAGALWWPHSVEYSPSANDTLSLAIGDFEAGTFFLYYDVQDQGADEITGDLPDPWGACVGATDDWRFGMYGTFDAEGPLFATVNNLGTNWTTPDSARINDDLCAAYNNTTQDYLCLHAFGFDIPTGATIDSFTVTVQSRGSAASGPARRYRVGMTKDSTNVYGTAVLQTAVNAGACASATDQTQSGDLLGGASWSAAEVNDRGFGVILYDDNTTANELNFDAVWITVYFTPAGVAETPLLDDIHSIYGAGKIQDVSDTTKVQHP